MRQYLRKLCLEENGQDLSEYSLIVAFFVLITFTLAGTGTTAITAIWHKVTNNLDSGVISASGG